MNREIIDFCRRVCKKYNLRAVFIPDVNSQNDLWSILTLQGMAVMNFTTAIFYHMPKRQREKMIAPTIKRGLNHLIGERKPRENNHLYRHRRMGKQIYP